jgi:replicative superfamily II helicase/ssDNA-binding Zn-finger/Zn-ribbon topoisomerase 1
MPYTEIRQTEFEDLLNLQGYKWGKLDDNTAKEVIYLVEIGGIGVKIFSSIVSGMSRGVGTDAIRVVGLDPVSGLPVMSSESRVYRTDNWRSNVVQRIDNVREKMKGIQKCQICGAMMVERTNSRTKERFMGCLNYKNHPKKGEKSSGIIVEGHTGNPVGRVLNIDIKPIVKNNPSITDAIIKVGGEFPSLNTSFTNVMTDTMLDAMASVVDNKKTVEETKQAIVNVGIKPEIKTIGDIKAIEVIGNEPLLDTKLYKWSKYPFDRFNVIQSEVNDFVEGDNNVVIEAKTSTGKTIMGELFMWPILASGKKVIYASPLKALTREKWDSWTKKFGEKGYKIAIITGDYRLTDKRIRELNEADIILCTSEMLDHRTRNMMSEKSEWLMKAGLLIIDEVQLIGQKDRGDKLEAGIMRFTLINPGCRVIFLSGTMPNSRQIAGWVKGLNKKETILIRSAWRPVKLNMKYVIYNDTQGYYAAKDNLFAGVMREVQDHNKDKILIFVHAKTDGRKIMGMLKETGYTVEFHNADLETDDRVNIEESFKSRDQGSVRIIIATSTLAYGLNLPARIVIIVGMHRGIEEVSELDIIQMAGRSGRMGIDTEGDAIILLPETQSDYLRKKIENPGDIMSQISEPVITGFHIIGEVVNKWVQTREDVYKWYIRTLASRQDMNISKEYVDQLIDYLIKNDAIKEVDGKLVETELGKACTYFYLRPDMLKDLMENWSKLFSMKIEGNDFVLTMALSRLRMYNDVIVSKADRGYIDGYLKATKAMETTFGGSTEGQAKIGMAYLNMLKGIKGVEVKDGKKIINPLVGIQRTLQNDIERIFQAMAYLDAKHIHWGRGTYWNSVVLRIKHGIGPELVDLCRLEGVGGGYAKKLYDSGIRAPIELLTKRNEGIMALGAKYQGIILKNREMFEVMGFKISADIVRLERDLLEPK